MTRAADSTTRFSDASILEEGDGNVVLFRPHVPAAASAAVTEVLQSRWIGQGPRVELFEQRLTQRLGKPVVAVNSGTSALHLSYLLAGLQSGDEVLTPVFTCTATNIPMLYEGLRPVFVDIEAESMTIDLEDAERKVGPKTRAIVVVHYGGYVVDMDAVHDFAQAHDLVVIQDAAQALGGSWAGNALESYSSFVAYSFQAIKHITTGDGGAVALPDVDLVEPCKRLRWFGIDRSAKQTGTWNNRIWEVGYKYQMTDIEAALGLAGLDELDMVLHTRRKLMQSYLEGIPDSESLRVIGRPSATNGHAAWLVTIASPKRREIHDRLRDAKIESAQVHFRNDKYEIFEGLSTPCPAMDSLEDEYLVLPLHTKMTTSDVERIVDVVLDAADS